MVEKCGWEGLGISSVLRHVRSIAGFGSAGRISSGMSGCKSARCYYLGFASKCDVQVADVVRIQLTSVPATNGLRYLWGCHMLNVSFDTAATFIA